MVPRNAAGLPVARLVDERHQRAPDSDWFGSQPILIAEGNRPLGPREGIDEQPLTTLAAAGGVVGTTVTEVDAANLAAVLDDDGTGGPLVFERLQDGRQPTIEGPHDDGPPHPIKSRNNQCGEQPNKSYADGK